MQLEILKTLENIGAEFAKLIPYFPLLKLLCFRLKQKYYPAVFFVGGAFAMTLITRCWYYFWPEARQEEPTEHSGNAYWSYGWHEVSGCRF